MRTDEPRVCCGVRYWFRCVPDGDLVGSPLVRPMKRLVCRLFRGGHYIGPVTTVLDCDEGMFVLNAPCYCGSPSLHWGYGSSTDRGWKVEGQFLPVSRFRFMRRLRKYGVSI